jgi:hypothetical protein
MWVFRFLALVWIGLPSVAFAWHDTGHMVVAEIAYRRLKPEVKDAVDALLQIGGEEKNRGFVMSACWADDVKSDRDRTWHYFDRFFRADGKPSANYSDEENAIFAVLRSILLLKDTRGAEPARANALRYLIHIVGDMHQPLHCVARETSALPGGDRGGNDFRIQPPLGLEPQPRNLHFLWDMGAGAFGSVQRPLTEDGRSQIKALADQAERLYPPVGRSREIAKLDPDDWAREGLELAKTRVYNIVEGGVPGDAYLQSCRTLSMQRVALAGYRLAELLNRVMPTGPESKAQLSARR